MAELCRKLSTLVDELKRKLLGDLYGLSHVAGGAIRRFQLCSPKCTLTEPHPDARAEYDVEIPTSVGLLKANIFKPRDGQKLPVIMCFHPYDNHNLPALGKTPLGGPPQQYRIINQEGKPEFSTMTSWESPDVNFWIANGYAVVNVNAPGYGGSGGLADVFDSAQAQAFHEAIEWVGAQPWSNGAVGLNGVSFLAITQWCVASHNGGKTPKALKCICPWEGFTDPRRDLIKRGGVLDRGFLAFWWKTEVLPALTEGAQAKFCDGDAPLEWEGKKSEEWWRERTPEVQNIRVPMLVCGSFSDHSLHSTGSFRGFVEAASTEKWLYTHRRGKWDAYYSDEVQQLTLKFFDFYVKGQADNGWTQTPRVRLEVRSAKNVVHEVRDEPAWPLPNTQYKPMHLCADGTLGAAAPPAAELTYSGCGGRLVFTHVFDAPTELTGYFRIKLKVEARDADDMAVFAAVLKRDAAGELVPFYGSVGMQQDGVTRGFQLASMRKLDPNLSRPYLPEVSYESQPLERGVPVLLDISTEPSATFFAKGESLELVLSSHEVLVTHPYVKSRMGNTGTHVVHLGPESQLVMPVVRELDPS